MNKPDWLNIDPSQPEPPILMLGRIDSGKNPDAHKAKTTSATQQTLNGIVGDFLGIREAGEFLPYSDTGLVGDDQTFVGDIDDIIATVPDGEGGVTEATSVLVELIQHARHTNDQITLEEFEDHRFTFYMVVAKNSDGEDVAYVRRTRGFKLTNNRLHFMSVGNNDALEIYEKPVFKLDLALDFALRGSDFAVWNVDHFLGMFIDVDALKAAVPSYLASIRNEISATLTDSTAERITAAADKSIRIAKQVKRISNLAYLRSVTAPGLQAYLAEAEEIASGIHVKGNTIDVEEDAVQAFLKLVDQRYWRGHFDQNLHEAQAFISPEAP